MDSIKSISALTRVFISLFFLIFNLKRDLIESKDDPDRWNIRFDSYFRWVTYGIILMEVSILFKFWEDTGKIFDETMSQIVFYSWLTVFKLLHIITHI